ncbi:MAG: CHAT domain-containing tetratricopeptide repeat protein [Candidatus Bipolaricaulia bacterium]
MKRVLGVLRFAVAVVCVLGAVTGVVFAQGGDEKTWEDAAQLYEEGMAVYSESRFWDAIALFEEALVIVRKLDAGYAEGLTLNMLGICYQDLSDYLQAIIYHEQSLAVKRETSDRIGEANSLNNLGNCYSALSEYRRAIDHHEQALTIRRDIMDRVGEATSLNNLGICYRALADYGRAIDYYEQSLAIKRKIMDQLGAAKSLNGLGNCYYSLSDYQRAIDYHEESLAIFSEYGYRIGAATSLNNLGNCYSALSSYQQAISHDEQSLAICHSIGDRAGEARSLNNIGICYTSLPDYQLAIDYYQQSLAIWLEIGDRAGEATSLGSLGNCYAYLSDYRKAIDYHEQALAILREIGDRAGEAIILGNLGVCSRSISDHQRAIDYLEEAVALSLELGTRETQRFACWGLGKTYRAMEQPETALPHYESAIAITESIRGAVGDEELRQSYFGSVRTLYEEYLELLLEMGRNEETILVAERLRARTFLDTLYQSGLAPEQLQLDEAGIDRTSEVVLPIMDFKVLKLAVEEAQGSLLPNEAVLEYMVGDDGVYLWIVLTDQTVGPQFILYGREQLLRDVVALRRAIEPQKKETDGEPELFFDDATAALRAFYETLLQPALAQLDDTVDTLIFVPSGPLWYVPFAALAMTDRPVIRIGGSTVAPETRPTYLVEEYTLAFLPSLASLPMLTKAETKSTGSYLAFANPTLSEEQQTAVGPHYQYGVLETACLAFATYVGGGEADVYVQTDAREELAYSSSTGQQVLMYACHGDFNPSVPLASRLLLAPSEEDPALSTDPRLPDGDYHASEVLLTDHTGVDLVVLAACETLLPTLREIQGVLGMTLGPESDEQLSLEQLELIVAGDEVVGLARSFLSSGAHSVLATLWQANATAIGKLLDSLGEHSQQESTWAQALCQAQRELIANEIFDDVWFWAPYQLIGRWR